MYKLLALKFAFPLISQNGGVTLAFTRGQNVMDTNSTINSVGNLTISIMEA
jgi:hypothetical protein